MKVALAFVGSLTLLLALAPGQTVPDVLYYRFNEGAGTSTANAAIPGAGSPQGMINGSLGFAPGMFGTGLVGMGGSSTTDYVATGYTMNLQGMSWTLEFWFSPFAGTSLQYLCGVPTSGAFRVFAGAPGNNLVMSGTGLTTVIVNTAVPQPGFWVHVAFVFDNSVSPPTITPYVNGAPLAPVVQTGSPVLNTGQLIVGGQTSTGLLGVMDEFRLWLTARTPGEILASYNVELSSANILTAQTAGNGVGDLTMTLTAISPGAAEGFILISAATSGNVGLGPVFGLYPDALTWSVFGYPLLPGSPFHFPIGIPGLFPDQPFSVPPGTLSILTGTSLDAVGILWSAGTVFLGKSNVVRINW